MTSSTRFRRAASQLCAAFPYYCLKFSYGTATGFQILLIAELSKKDSEIPMTDDQLGWFASLNVLNILGTTITGFTMQRVGSRLVALLTTVLFISQWLLFHYSSSATIILVARGIAALPATIALTTPYVSEISEPHLRGAFLVICQMTTIFGSFFSLLLGNFLNWRTIALVNLVFPVSAALTVLATPNSPAWLANKGRLEEAEKSLCWLRGWVPANQVQAEFSALVKSVQSVKSISNEQKVDVELADKTTTSSRNIFQLFLQRSFYLPLGTMCIIHLVYQLSGTMTIQTYSAVIFQKINSPIKSSIATAIMGAIIVLGNISTMLLIHRIGKRKLAFFSAVIAGLSFALIALIQFLELQGSYLWVPTIALLVGLFADFSGMNSIVFMLGSEVFPSSVRYIGSSVSITFAVILSSVMYKLFFLIVDTITLHGTFLLFAVGNLVALITYYFVMPETEGRSLKEIEDHFSGVKKLNERRD